MFQKEVTVVGTLKRETDKAALVQLPCKVEGETQLVAVWLPKSQVQVRSKVGTTVTINVPGWLAAKNSIVAGGPVKLQNIPAVPTPSYMFICKVGNLKVMYNQVSGKYLLSGAKDRDTEYDTQQEARDAANSLVEKVSVVGCSSFLYKGIKVFYRSFSRQYGSYRLVEALDAAGNSLRGKLPYCGEGHNLAETEKACIREAKLIIDYFLLPADEKARIAAEADQDLF